MQADPAHRRKAKVLGAVFCFLAVLFFVEAKTAWAYTGHCSPADIAAAKACDTEKVDHSAEFKSLQIVPSVWQTSTSFGLTAPELRLPSGFAVGQLMPDAQSNFAAQQGFLPFAHSSRPPPQNR